MNNLRIGLTLILALLLSMVVDVGALHKDKPRPEAWKDLVYGARFMDRIVKLIYHKARLQLPQKV